MAPKKLSKKSVRRHKRVKGGSNDPQPRPQYNWSTAQISHQQINDLARTLTDREINNLRQERNSQHELYNYDMPQTPPRTNIPQRQPPPQMWTRRLSPNDEYYRMMLSENQPPGSVEEQYREDSYNPRFPFGSTTYPSEQRNDNGYMDAGKKKKNKKKKNKKSRKKKKTKSYYKKKKHSRRR